MVSSVSEPMRFWFDFASPYAYFALPRLRAVAERHGRSIELKPMLLWAVFKAQGIAPPLDVPHRKAYLLADMERSAAFHGLPLHTPLRIPFSSHAAGRLFYGIGIDHKEATDALAASLLRACFADGADITRTEVLQAIVARQGLDPGRALGWMEAGRDRLAAAVDGAVAAGVIGSPFIEIDGEHFFGADRLPQIEWRLSGRSHKAENA